MTTTILYGSRLECVKEEYTLWTSSQDLGVSKYYRFLPISACPECEQDKERLGNEFLRKLVSILQVISKV